MKKHIITAIIIFIVISFVSYFFICDRKTKQAQKEKSIEEIAEELKQDSLAHRKNLEQKILFYKNDPDSAKILEELYLEKGKLCRKDKKYKIAFECFQQALKLAQKSDNKDNIALAAWNLMRLASLQDKTDLVLSLNNKFENIIRSKFGKISIMLEFYYYWVGNAYLKRNNLEKASEYLTPGIKITDKICPRVVAHYALLMCAFSILKVQRQDFQEALKRLNKVIDNFYDFNYSDYNYEEKKRFLEALAILEKCNPPPSFELSSFYKKIAKKYIVSDNKMKFEEYIFKAIKVLEKLKANKEKIANLYYELGTLESYTPNKYFDKCTDILKDAKGKDAAYIIYKIAHVSYDEKSEYSLRLLLRSLKMLPESGEKPLWVIRAYHLIAYCYNERKEWQKSAEYSKKCLALINKEPKLTKATLALDCYSFLDDFYNSQGDLKKRIKNAEDAVKFMLDVKAKFIILNTAYEELAKIYKIAKRYSDAEKCCRKIINVFEKNPKLIESTEYLKQKINAYCEIGDLCLLQKVKKRAEKAFNKASKLLKRKNAAKLAEWYLNKTCINIADGYYYLSKYKLAEKYYRKLLASPLAEKMKSPKTVAYLCYRIGDIAFIQKKWQKAQKYFEKSWKNIDKKEGNIDSVIILSSKLSICYRTNKQFKKGLKFALTAYEKQKSKYGNNLKTGIYAAGVGSFYNQLKNKNKALEFLEIAHQLLKKYGESQPALAEKVSQHINEIKND